MWWGLGVVAVAALLSAYLVWTAHRVERVHVRAASAERALDAHLVRRAAAAAVVAEQQDAAELYAAARLALDAEPGEREAAENDLTRALQSLPLQSAPLAGAATRTMIATSRRVVLARRYPRPSYFDIEEPALLVLPPRPAADEPAIPVEAA
jgi:hypothetical protein